MVKRTLTQEELKEMFEYNPQSGIFTSKVKQGKLKAGRVVGTTDKTRYLFTHIKGKKYSLHRLAFLYMTGSFPKHSVDHLNRVRDDNRWENLRDVDQSVNMRNRTINSNNKAGVKGVFYDNHYGRWMSRITDTDGKRISKCFKSKEDATKWRITKEKEFGYE